MGKNISIQNIIKEFKTNAFILNCQMPIGYSTAFPILQIKNGSLCLLIPFLRYKVTGKTDQTLVYPIKYTACIELPEQNIVSFSNLSFDERFENISFAKPVGLFRHDSIKNLTKTEYQKLRTETFNLYDKLATALLEGIQFADEDDKKMRKLLKLLVEPSLYPMYKALDKDFFEKYLA